MHRVSKLTMFAIAFFWAFGVSQTPSYAGGLCNGQEPKIPFAKAGQEIRIADWAFSRGLTGYCPSERLPNQAKKPTKLYFWMRLEAGKQTLEKLKAEGRLPIKHRWYAYVGGQIEADWNKDIPTTDAIDDDADKLATEVEARGYFDWRTQTKRQLKYESTAYRIDILDAQNDPIPCAEGLDCLSCENDILCGVVMRIE